jgi:hypothetical protein
MMRVQAEYPCPIKLVKYFNSRVWLAVILKGINSHATMSGCDDDNASYCSLLARECVTYDLSNIVSASIPVASAMMFAYTAKEDIAMSSTISA